LRALEFWGDVGGEYFAIVELFQGVVGILEGWLVLVPASPPRLEEFGWTISRTFARHLRGAGIWFNSRPVVPLRSTTGYSRLSLRDWGAHRSPTTAHGGPFLVRGSPNAANQASINPAETHPASSTSRVLHHRRNRLPCPCRL
jgi:hypothetical protein